jgi:hypothetical protein
MPVTLNIATMLAGIKDALPVSPRLAETFGKKFGLENDIGLALGIHGVGLFCLYHFLDGRHKEADEAELVGIDNVKNFFLVFEHRT